VIVFDKTGTLTVLQPELADFLTESGSPFTQDQILSAVQSIEAHSHHPIASVFLSDESKQDPTRNIELIPGVGVCGDVNIGGTWHRVEVGRLEELHRPCCDGQFLAQIRDAVGTGQQPIAIRMDDALVAVGIVQETTIDTLIDGVAKLRELGVEIKLFSGDGGHRLDRIGISDATGKMTPEAKLAGVRSLESSGDRVLFVGDGVNDAAAMTASTVAISVASGADLATESSDIVWHGQDLRAISDAITIARRSVSRLRRALLFAVTYNTIGMLIAASGWLHPVVAVLLMLGSSLTVVLHAADLNWESEEAEPPPLLSGEPQRSSVNPPNDQRDARSAVPSLVQIGSKAPVTL
ncbi:MAG: HAD-IC family P-type ATPase, partial [Rubripirellula sp.]